jgi:hypothetical protein
MSSESKEIIKKIKEDFKRIQKEADDASKRVVKFDPGLADKIKKCGDEAGEVQKHIQERMD